MTALVRDRRPELMDAPEPDPEELSRSLADLRRVNRWLGGTRVLLRRLWPILERVRERPVRVLDVATGSADIPLILAHRGRARGIELRVTATDLHPMTLDEARRRAEGEPWVEVRAADALALPFGDDAFHFALCNTALHHFDEADAATALREMARVASAGIVVGDLLRSRSALLGAELLAATVWRRHPITRHDGPRSVRGAFTADELAALARRAGLPEARVRTEPVFRLSLVVDRTRGGAA